MQSRYSVIQFLHFIERLTVFNDKMGSFITNYQLINIYRMKFNFLIGAVIAGLLFFSCQKNYEPFGTENTTSGAFSAKINGTYWEATGVKTALRTNGLIILNGNSPGKSIVISLADSGVHNYKLLTTSALSLNIGAWTDSSLTTSVGVVSFGTDEFDVDGQYGSVNVTSIDTANKTISGTFEMRVYRQVDSMQLTFTEGKFTNISYASQIAPPSGTDSFRVKLDGAQFNYTGLVAVKAVGLISVSAYNGSGTPGVAVNVPDNITPGTYNFSVFGDQIGQYNESMSSIFLSDSGNVTILEHNLATKRIRGNFGFRAKNLLPPTVNHRLTEGYFAITYL